MLISWFVFITNFWFFTLDLNFDFYFVTLILHMGVATSVLVMRPAATVTQNFSLPATVHFPRCNPHCHEKCRRPQMVGAGRSQSYCCPFPLQLHFHLLEKPQTLNLDCIHWIKNASDRSNARAPSTRMLEYLCPWTLKCLSSSALECRSCKSSAECVEMPQTLNLDCIQQGFATEHSWLDVCANPKSSPGRIHIIENENKRGGT